MYLLEYYISAFSRIKIMLRHCLNFIFIPCITDKVHDINQQNNKTCSLDIYIITHLTFMRVSDGKKIHLGITPK